MAVTHPTAIRNNIADLVVDKLDVGGAGHLIFQTSGDAEVAICPFGATAFGAAASGTATANAITADTSANAGTIAKARARDQANTEIFQCSVTATGGGGDITLNSVTISAGQEVGVTSLTYSAPP